MLFSGAFIETDGRQETRSLVVDSEETTGKDRYPGNQKAGPRASGKHVFSALLFGD